MCLPSCFQSEGLHVSLASPQLAYRMCVFYMTTCYRRRISRLSQIDELDAEGVPVLVKKKVVYGKKKPGKKGEEAEAIAEVDIKAAEEEAERQRLQEQQQEEDQRKALEEQQRLVEEEAANASAEAEKAAAAAAAAALAAPVDDWEDWENAEIVLPALQPAAAPEPVSLFPFTSCWQVSSHALELRACLHGPDV